MLSKSEKKVLRLLLVSVDVDYSINNVAKECGLSPNGALKILKKFQKQGILKTKKIANIISYRINFEDDAAVNIMEISLMSELNSRVRSRMEDLKPLRDITCCCIMFGSYTSSKKEPDDIDLLFVIKKENFRKYKQLLSDIRLIVPAKIHDVLQTEQDIKDNIVNGDKVVIDVLRTGIVLWGWDIVVDVIKDVYRR